MRLKEAILKQLTKNAKEDLFERKVNRLMRVFEKNRRKNKKVLWEISLTKDYVTNARTNPLTPAQYIYGLITIGAEIGKLNPVFKKVGRRGNPGTTSASSIISLNYSPVNNLIKKENFLMIKVVSDKNFYIGIRGEYLNEFLIVYEPVAKKYGRMDQIKDKAKFLWNKAKNFFKNNEEGDNSPSVGEINDQAMNDKVVNDTIKKILKEPVFVVGTDGLYAILNLLVAHISNIRKMKTAQADMKRQNA